MGRFVFLLFLFSTHLRAGYNHDTEFMEACLRVGDALYQQDLEESRQIRECLRGDHIVHTNSFSQTLSSSTESISSTSDISTSTEDLEDFIFHQKALCLEPEQPYQVTRIKPSQWAGLVFGSIFFLCCLQKS